MSDDEKKIKRPLDEITGIIGSTETRERGGPGPPGGGGGGGAGPARRSKTGMTIGVCHKLTGWQNEVIYRLKQGRDVYIATDPGAGKTPPVFCYWAEQILNLNPRQQARPSSSDILHLADRVIRIIGQPGDFSKVLYFCPQRTLVSDVAQKFREILANVFDQAMQIVFDNLGQRSLTDFIENAVIGNRGLNIDNRYLGGIVRNLKNIDNEIRKIERNNPSREEQKRIEHLKNQRQQIVQDLQKRISASLRSRLTQLIATRSGAHNDGNPRSALVTVSVVESAQNVLDKDLGLRALQNVKLIAFDESHLFQESSQESNPNESARNKVKNLHFVLQQISKFVRNTRVVLMSGTVHPQAVKDFVKYLKKCFNREFSVIKDSEAKNPSQIKVIPSSKISDESYQIKLLTNPDSENNLLIIFSQKIIIGLTKKAIETSSKASLAAVDRGTHRKNTSNYPDRKLSPEDYDEEFSPGEIARKATEIPGAENLYEDLQVKAVSAGFGFIIRPDDRGPDAQKNTKRYLNDIEIVAELFKKGKIHTLLSTHAVGIGVNIEVKTMYIPSIKDPGAGFEKMETGKASQLYNRVGRAAFPIGTVVTKPEFQNDVIQALNAGQDQYDRGINFNPDLLGCNSSSLKSALMSALITVSRTNYGGGKMGRFSR